MVVNTQTVVANTQTGQFRETDPQIVWIDDTLSRTLNSTVHHRKPGGYTPKPGKNTIPPLEPVMTTSHIGQFRLPDLTSQMSRESSPYREL